MTRQIAAENSNVEKCEQTELDFFFFFWILIYL